MNKLTKRIMLTIPLALSIGALAFTKVSAATTLAYSVDNDPATANASLSPFVTTYAKGTEIYSDDLASVLIVKPVSKVTGPGSTAEDGSGLTFTCGFVSSGSNNQLKDAMLNITSKAAGTKIGFYYTTSDGKFSSTATSSKGGSLKVLDEAGGELYTSEASQPALTVARYAEYTINGENETVNICSSTSRLVLFGFTVSQGEVSTTHNVTIKESDETILKEQEIVDGQYVTYEPAKFGYDFDGYYTDNGFTTAYDAATTPVTTDLTLYAKFTKWDDSIISQNELSQALVDKLAANYTSISEELELTGTIYSLMPGTTMKQSSGINCVGTDGSLSTTKNAIKIVAPSDGTLTIKITTNGSSARNAKLVDSSNTEVTVSSGNSEWDATAASSYEQRELVYNLTAGTYYLGGSNGMRIFTASFSENIVADLQYQLNDTATSYRLVGKLTNVSDLALIENIQITIQVANSGTVLTGNISIQSVYTSVSGLNPECNKEDGVYYIVYTINGIQDFIGSDLTATLNVTVAGYSANLTDTTSTYTIV